MGGSSVLPGSDTLVLAIPFLGLLAMMMFGLDERSATPRRRPVSRRFFCGVDGANRAFLSDPDGTLWQKRGVRQVEARLIKFGGAEGGESRIDDQSRPAGRPITCSYVIEND